MLLSQYSDLFHVIRLSSTGSVGREEGKGERVREERREREREGESKRERGE